MSSWEYKLAKMKTTVEGLADKVEEISPHNRTRGQRDGTKERTERKLKA